VDQALVTFGLGYEVALAAAAECWEALVGQHRTDKIVDSVLGQGCGQGYPRLSVQVASFIF
jgi:hypothetical protein